MTAEEQAEAIVRIQKETAEAIKRINISVPSAQAQALESMRRFAKKGTKIMIPIDGQHNFMDLKELIIDADNEEDDIDNNSNKK